MSTVVNFIVQAGNDWWKIMLAAMQERDVLALNLDNNDL